MVERARLARACAALGCAALLALGACASGGGKGGKKASEADLLVMLTMLPGRYDNSVQADLDVRDNVHPAHESVVLVITHVFTPRLGKYVYDAQESAANDPRRILSHKMYGFELDEKRHRIVQTLYELNEPGRWRDGYLNKDLFTSLEMEDVQPEGCVLVWEKKGDGFAAAHDPKACPDSAAAAATPQMELAAGALAVGDYKFRKGR